MIDDIPQQIIEKLRLRVHALKAEADARYKGLAPEIKDQHLHQLVDELMENAMAAFHQVSPDADQQELTEIHAHLARLVHSFLGQ